VPKGQPPKQPTLPGGPEIGRCVHQLQMSPSLPFRNVMAVGGEVEKRPPGLVVGLPATLVAERTELGQNTPSWCDERPASPFWMEQGRRI
jgi:hypothetical protein